MARLVVSLNTAEDRPPVATYLADVIAVDGWLDAAVIKIQRKVDGAAVLSAALNLPFIAIGDSGPDALHINDAVTLVGFPGLGGSTVSLTTGIISGFLDDAKTGPRGWIKTSAAQSPGNSGGLGANSQGQIIGIPTQGIAQPGAFGELRPINLVKPLIEAARSNAKYTSSVKFVPKTGAEKFVFLSWTEPTAQGCGTGAVGRYPSGAKAVRATFRLEGLADGEDLLVWWSSGTMQPTWTGDARVVAARKLTWKSSAMNGSCVFEGMASDAAIPDDTYSIWIYVGPQLNLLGQRPVSVGGQEPPTELKLRGKILDADTKKGIAAATVTVLRTGTDVNRWLTGRSTTAVIASAQTDSTGAYLLDRFLPPGAYTIVVEARGYPSLSGDLTVQAGNTSISDLAITKSSP